MIDLYICFTQRTTIVRDMKYVPPKFRHVLCSLVFPDIKLWNPARAGQCTNIPTGAYPTLKRSK